MVLGHKLKNMFVINLLNETSNIFTIAKWLK
jgi:hypothetical protein